MTDIRKFIADVDKVKKHNRQNNGTNSGYDKLSKDLRSLFERSTSCGGQLPGSIFEYWENQYVRNSADLTWEPGEENTNRLAAFLAFLENSSEYEELLTSEDWQELSELVNYEADDLPIDTLQELMAILVSKGAY